MAQISTLNAGDHFAFKGYNWVVLDPQTKEGGVFSVMADVWDKYSCLFDEDGNNNYANSSLRRKINEELLPELGEENFLLHIVDLTADNGDDRYGTVEDKVFIFSCDEYRKYYKYFPCFSEWIWTCTPWYISPAGNGRHVRYVGPTRYVYTYGAHGCCGVVVAAIFKNNTEIEI